MTATETPTPTASPPAAAVETAPGLYRAVATSDHKTIGRLYIGFSLIFALIVLVVGLLAGFERADQSGIDILSDESIYLQAYTLFKIGLIALVVVPLFLGVANLVVPLQVGAPALAFPRAGALAFWTWLAGGAIFAISIAVDGGFSTAGTEADAVELTVVGLIMALVAIVLASVCLATTVISLRPAGMSLRRVPFFAWSILVAATVWLLSLPVAVANLVIGYVDLRNPEPVQFATALGADIAWLVRPPQVFAFAIPALGILFDSLATAAKLRQRNYGVVQAGIALFGLLSFGAFVQNTASNIEEQFVYLAMAFALLAPVLLLLGGLGDSLMRGRTGLPPVGLLFALIGTLVIFAGVAMAAIRAIVGFDLIQPPGTTATDAVYAAALLGGFCAALGGVAWWSPKITGRLFPAAGRALALLVGGGALAAAVPELVSGFLDQPGGFQATLPEVKDGVEVLNLIAAIGVAAVALGTLGFIGLLLKAARSQQRAGADPYDGQTLEWLADSPPAPGNFAEAVASVRSAQPLLDSKAEKGAQ